MRHVCTNCGIFIVKSAINDPYLCRECEKMLEKTEPKERYTYLDTLR